MAHGRQHLFTANFSRQSHSLAAGCITGAVLAVQTRSMPVILLSSALSGGLMLAVEVTTSATKAAMRRAKMEEWRDD